jgi:hypothetical protein
MGVLLLSRKPGSVEGTFCYLETLVLKIDPVITGIEVSA